ncbi:SulP family inorganic anion transporter [Pseudooceanicola sp. LIPI14-2-Ac024]|uniref:SulP family inorganic anion transporter n=1 Tax=Pseudooceanicola sp. LIPI14-2-Ac024 TaxID=3344875 RepID=UPI0035CF3719
MRLEPNPLKTLNVDLGAGLALALVSIPGGLAYALVAGVNPIYGVYTSMVATVVAALIGSSSLMVVTLTNALALVTADQILDYTGEVETVRVLMTLTFLTGVMMALLGALNLGSVIRFVSKEVMAGFIFATALLIVLGQLKDLVGYASLRDGNKLVKAADILRHAADWTWPAALLGFAAIAALFALKATRLARFSDIIVIVAVSLVVLLPAFASVQTVADIADVPRGLAALPAPILPDFSVVPLLLGGAFAATVVGLSESSGLAAAYPNPNGTRSNVSRDFLGQGCANIVGAFFHGMPASGSLSRTGIVAGAGARTRFANIYSGLLLAVILVLFGNGAEYIPLTGLAALLTVVGLTVTIREGQVLIRAWRTSLAGTLIALTTIVVGVLDDLTAAIFAGVILSLLLETVRAARRFRVVELVRDPDGHWREQPAPREVPPGKVTVIDLRGTLNFASYYDFDSLLPRPDTGADAVLILRLRDREVESLTSIEWLETYVDKMARAGGRVVLSEVTEATLAVLKATGAEVRLGAANIYPATDVFYDATERAVAEATSPAPKTPDAAVI